MKSLLSLAALIAAGALLLAGCGKSDEQKKMEADLNSQIMKGHEVEMAKMAQAESLMNQLNARIAANDSLARVHPKETAGHSSGSLASARDRLESSRHAMESWMENYTPYNEGIKHDQAMAQLRSDLNTLMQVRQQMDTAIVDATRQISEQQAFENELAAKTSKGKRK